MEAHSNHEKLSGLADLEGPGWFRFLVNHDEDRFQQCEHWKNQCARLLTHKQSEIKQIALKRHGHGPTELRYEALLKLLRTADTVWNSSRVFFARWDLSPAQFNVINLLGGATEGMSQTDLGRELLTHRSNVTGLVDRLEEKGMVKREACAGDRRAWQVQLTPAGKKLWEDILPHYRSAADSVWGETSAEQTQEMIGLLVALEKNASEWVKKR